MPEDLIDMGIIGFALCMEHGMHYPEPPESLDAILAILSDLEREAEEKARLKAAA